MADSRDDLLETYDPKAAAKMVPLAQEFAATKQVSPLNVTRLELRDHFLRTFPTAEAIEQFLKAGTLPVTFDPALRRLRSGSNPVHDIARELYIEQKNVLPDQRRPMRTPDPLQGLGNLATSGAIIYPVRKLDILADMKVPAVFSTLIEKPFRHPAGQRIEGHLFLTLPPNHPKWALDGIKIAGERLAKDEAYHHGVERLAIYTHDLPENTLDRDDISWFRERLALVGSIQTIKGKPTFDMATPMLIPYRPAVIDQNVHTEIMTSMGEPELGYSRSLIRYFNEVAESKDKDRVQIMANIDHSHLHHTLRSMRRATPRDYRTQTEEPVFH